MAFLIRMKSSADIYYQDNSQALNATFVLASTDAASDVMIAAKLKGLGRRNIYSKTKLYREGLIKHRSPLLNSKL